jgi:hypothetical protein
LIKGTLTDTKNINSITHFEIYGAELSGLAGFTSVFGWGMEQMPRVDHWRVGAARLEAY